MVYIKIQTRDNTSTFIADICIDRITVPVGLSVLQQSNTQQRGFLGSLQNYHGGCIGCMAVCNAGTLR